MKKEGQCVIRQITQKYGLLHKQFIRNKLIEQCKAIERSHSNNELDKGIVDEEWDVSDGVRTST